MSKLSHILTEGKMKEATPDDIQPTGQYFTVDWKRLERILQGKGPVSLLAEHEYIKGIEATEHGLRICIGDEKCS